LFLAKGYALSGVFGGRFTGTLDPGDFIGSQTYALADGSVLPSFRFVLHQVNVGAHAVKDVIASVAPAKSEYPLLGQSFLSGLRA
jgi:hypothetical protein